MRSTTLPFLFLALAMPAIAQTPAGEISGGWSFLVDEFQHYPLGFQIGGAWRLTDSLALVGDFGWNRLTLRFPQFKSQRTLTTFSGGPRFYFGERVTGFAHVLVGVIRLNQTTSDPDPDLILTPYDYLYGGDPFPYLAEGRTESAFMIQPGGGVDIRVSDQAAIRLQGDYQWINAPPWYLRFVADGVFYLGQR